jgi:hypothetical protein
MKPHSMAMSMWTSSRSFILFVLLSAGCSGSSPLPPEDLPFLHRAVLDELLGIRVVSSRGRRNQRGVKRKMSNYNLRRKGQRPLQPGIVYPLVRLLK